MAGQRLIGEMVLPSAWIRKPCGRNRTNGVMYAFFKTRSLAVDGSPGQAYGYDQLQDDAGLQKKC